MSVDLSERVILSFQESIETKKRNLSILSSSVARASEMMLDVLLHEGKILACGNGGSACDAQHFASELVNRYRHDRPALPALALGGDAPTLTSIANDMTYDDVFARPIRALGKERDLLLAITTSGHSPNIIKAVEAAHDRGMRVVALSGRDGGVLSACLSSQDCEIRVASEVTARIQETHLLVIHILCELLDFMLFGHDDHTEVRLKLRVSLDRALDSESTVL